MTFSKYFKYCNIRYIKQKGYEMKKIILGLVLIFSISYGDRCSYHIDELSKSMTKTKLYAKNGMVSQTKLALQTTRRHNIEAIAECEDSKTKKALQKNLEFLKTAIKIDGKPL